MSPNHQLVELAEAVGRIEGKLDALVGIPKRVSSLEHFRTKAMAYATLAGSLCGAAVTLLADTFTGVLANIFKH